MSIPKKKSRIFGPRRRKWDNTSFNCKNNSRQEVSGTNNSQTSAELFRTHRLLPAYSQIAKPLSDLTKKENPFMFEQPQMEAFEKLKKLLTESPVLSIFQQGRTTELHTDASQQGYGAVLLQEKQKTENYILSNICRRKRLQQKKNIVAMNWKFLLLSTL
ncbi:retrovirus-related Pol polyprotein from transposon 17.6 [Trichonephila clavipes]|nr:retrovirus-related Pol polyprotein from transposon 17.6 [Trichonephila clavipes]